MATTVLSSADFTQQRVAAAGWLSWTTFVMTVLLVSTNATIDRRNPDCAAGGAIQREWRFTLLPFGQVCTQTDASAVQTAMLVAQTAVVWLSLLVALAATCGLLVRIGRGLPPMAKSLIIAQASGVALALVAVVLMHPEGSGAAVRDGLHAGVVWQASAAMALVASAVGATHLILALVAKGRQAA